MIKKHLSFFALAITSAAALLCGCQKKDDSSSDSAYGLSDTIENGAILHCFSWSFPTITESMEDIALAGYSAIQTSPINACYDGGDAGIDLFGSGKWYYHYQPTDWTIGNYQLGTKDEFKEMCETAHSYGIKVIVDVAPNHTTTTTDAISENLIQAVGGFDKLYHKDGMTSIQNYKNRAQCTLNAVGGLYDVNTENPGFQDYFISYLNDVISCGADGFRYDTAKHIGLFDDPQDDPSLPNNFWDRVTTEPENASNLFLYGECLQDGGERISDYINKIGHTTASDYGFAIRTGITAGMLSAKSLSDFRIGDAAPNVVTWVESHDNYTGDDDTGKTISNKSIQLAWTLLAAREEGTPLFFDRPYGAEADSKWGTFNKIGMAGDNLYKSHEITAANRFRNAMIGEKENIFNPDEANKSSIVIERGSKGLVLVNASANEASLSFKTSLKNGSYTDRVDEATVYTVKDGTLSCTVPGKTAVILYNDGYLNISPAAFVKVSDDTDGMILGDSLEVTLVSENCESASYFITENATTLTPHSEAGTAFKNGDKITIGETLAPGETLCLTLCGENKDGRKTNMTYIFRKQDTVKEGTKIYFEKPEGWSDSISCYVYDETSYSETKQNYSWPGKPMELTDSGLYSYTFTEEWIAPLVIFTDGTRQSNGALEPGENVIADKVYTVSQN